MNFQIKKFTIETLRERCEMDSRKSPMIVIIGKKDTGKSFLVRDILCNTQSAFPIGTVISGTEVANEFFQHMVPSKLIHDKYEKAISC
jgi:ATPase subunit of ABC transporter with duplicated ATPase domains